MKLKEVTPAPETLALFRTPPEGDDAHRCDFTFAPDNKSDYTTLTGCCSRNVIDLLAAHCEVPGKGTNAVIFGTCGEDGRGDVRTISALAYDIDDTLSAEEVEAGCSRAGFHSVVFTTYNHGRTKHFFGAEEVRKISRANDVRLTDDEGRAFCTAMPKLAKLKNVRVLHAGALTRKDGKIGFEIEHDPEVRLRVIVILKEPIQISKLGKEGYRALYVRIGRQLLGGDYFDVSGARPSQIFYLPTKPVGTSVKHESFEFKGPYLDWRPSWEEIEPELLTERERKTVCAAEAAARRAAMPASDRAREVYECLELIPPNIEYRDWYRVLAAIMHELDYSEEARAIAHEWSAGAPNLYEELQVDQILDSLDEREDGATMGTLIHLARERDPSFRTARKPASLYDLDLSLLGLDL